MNRDRLVYSTDGGRAEEDTRSSNRGRRPKQRQAPALPSDGVVRLFRERGSRGGKVVTVIRGLPAHQVETMAVELKRLCGAGGTVRDGSIEIQGDQRERIAQHLTAQGHKVKLAGG